MGDHVHPKGTWMASYRFMYMPMPSLLQGSVQITDQEAVLQHYKSVPLEMVMQMHMVGAMFAPWKHINVMVMVPYIYHRMDMLMRSGASMQMVSKGFGDMKVSVLYSIVEKERHWFNGQIGFSLPTGPYTLRMANGMLFPYPMQLGSGTIDPLLRLTYRGFSSQWSWGMQGSGLLRLYNNALHYRLGSVLQATAWLAHRWCTWLSVSARLSFNQQTRIVPAPANQIVPVASPLADAQRNSGSRRLYASLGVNLQPLPYLNIGIEGFYPLYQRVSGIQMRQGTYGTIGIRTLF